MTLNMLKLNDTKTEVMIIKPSRNQSAIEVENVRIADADIKPSKKAKNIGVVFDEVMSMNPHVSAVCSSCTY